MQSPRPATVLHTSDCHLDENDDGRHRAALAAAIDASIEHDVDLLLITGDLFDSSRVGDSILEWTADQLDRANRPIVLIVGNHDCLHERSVHHRFAAASRCRQVQFIDDPEGRAVKVPGTDIVVWARAMVEHEPAFRPLRRPAARTKGRWHIVAGHGLVVGGAGDQTRSSPIFPAELEELDADYVALGHIHTYQIVREQPLTVYPGATASSHDGHAGCVIVRLTVGEKPSMRWLPLELDSRI